jgi:hypothetical protein
MLALLMASATFAAAGAHADGDERGRPYSFQLGAQWVEPLASARVRFSSGLGFGLGVTLRPLPLLGFQAAYAVSVFDVRSGVVPGAHIDGDQLLQSWSLRVILTPVHAGRFGFYLIAGPGLYVRHVDIAAVQGQGVAPVCDAWLLVCGRSVAVSSLPGGRDALEFGVQGGLGVSVAVEPHTRVFAEARYEIVWGDELRAVQAPSGMPSRANQEYVPIVLGVDF